MTKRFNLRSLASLGSTLSLIAALGVGCSSATKKFEQITPGMSEAEVKKAMDQGPSRFETISDQYTSWYWNNDYCVLFKNTHVVAKDSSQSSRDVKVGGGGYQEKHNPQCLAPGQVAKGSTDRSVNIPGIGTIHLPQGQLTADPNH